MDQFVQQSAIQESAIRLTSGSTWFARFALPWLLAVVAVSMTIFAAIDTGRFWLLFLLLPAFLGVRIMVLRTAKLANITAVPDGLIIDNFRATQLVGYHAVREICERELGWPTELVYEDRDGDLRHVAFIPAEGLRYSHSANPYVALLRQRSGVAKRGGGPGAKADGRTN